MRPLAAWLTVPATAMRLVVWPTVSGAATTMAAPSRLLKLVAVLMARSVVPSRCSARSRRLARTEAPTSRAPASTATATATPAPTSRWR